MRCSNRRTNICQLMTLIPLLFFLLIPLSVKADQQYCVQYNIPNVTSPLTPNQTVTVQATLTNCGNLKWTKNKFTLSYHWYSGSNVVVWDGARSSLPQDVGHEETVSLTAQVTAPSTEGTYTLKWDMVYEPGTWFSSMGNATNNQTIEVKSLVEPIKAAKKLKSEQVVSMAFSSSMIYALTTTLYTPKITSVYPAPPIIPDKDYLISGSGFGDKPGQVKMTLPSGQTYNLNLVAQIWSPGLIRVHVPAITGEKDGSASIQVETAGKISSNKFSVDFFATRDIAIADGKLLGLGISCGDPTFSQDSCSLASATWGTFCGDHYSACCFSGDNDYDKFWTVRPLRDGWVFNDYECNIYTTGKVGTIKETFSGMGSPSMKATIEWWDDLWGGVDYCCVVQIIGPKGVPYQ